MKQLTVNGKATQIPEPPRLVVLLRMLDPRPPYAIAHNEEFVPATEYEAQELAEGDRIEIVHPASGG